MYTINNNVVKFAKFLNHIIKWKCDQECLNLLVAMKILMILVSL
jgi:hypothetical protein